MSISITLKVAEVLSLEEMTKILIDRINMERVQTADHIIHGAFEGGNVAILKASEMTQQLCDEMYGVKPQTVIDFGVDKFAPYAVSYGNIFDGIIALVKVTHQDAIASEEDRPFLRRLNGQITLYNNGGLFDANVVPQWRPKFDFEHAFKELFER
jgi:hypothetical protein